MTTTTTPSATTASARLTTTKADTRLMLRGVRLASYVDSRPVQGPGPAGSGRGSLSVLRGLFQLGRLAEGVEPAIALQQHVEVEQVVVGELGTVKPVAEPTAGLLGHQGLNLDAAGHQQADDTLVGGLADIAEAGRAVECVVRARAALFVH